MDSTKLHLSLALAFCLLPLSVASATPSSTTYIGDDAAEGLSITPGGHVDTAKTICTYESVAAGAIYTNQTTSMQQLTVTQVNFYAGTGTGTLTPFLAIYVGDQTKTSIMNPANYDVFLIGDPINVTANSGLQNLPFLVKGKSPTINLAPNQVLTAGFMTSSGQIVQNDHTATGTPDYVIEANTIPASIPNAMLDPASLQPLNLDRTLKFNVGFTVSTSSICYMGDDASEGASITDGTTQDTSTSPVTYAFAAPADTYVNTSQFIQKIILTQVNFYAGASAGTLTPFVALYTGDQTTSAIKSGASYQVLAVGDTISVAANSGRQNQAFTVNGQNPLISLGPNQVLVVGFLSSTGHLVRNDGTSTGLIDYVIVGNALPSSFPNSLTANTTLNLDRTLKFNVGFAVESMTYLGDDASEGAQITNGTKQDTATQPVTYAFASSGVSYTNTTGLIQEVFLDQVNFYAGSTGGTLVPFAAIYSGNQSSASIKTGSNYNVVAVGDSLNVPANGGLQNDHFLVYGISPSILLQADQTQCRWVSHRS